MYVRKSLIVVTLTAFIAVPILSGCESRKEQENLGTAVGGVLGGALGSKIGRGTGRSIAIALGAIAGALYGRKVARMLDEYDLKFAERTTQDTLENNDTGTQSTWSNPDSGNSGTVTPTRTYKVNGADCREFESTVTVDGDTEIVKGRACRDADGQWRVVPS